MVVRPTGCCHLESLVIQAGNERTGLQPRRPASGLCRPGAPGQGLGHDPRRPRAYDDGALGAGVRHRLQPRWALLATGSQDKTIKLWDAATGTLVRTLEPHGSWIRSVAFSPDGARLVSGSGAELFTPNRTGEMILWDVATGRELRRFAGPHDRIYGVAYRPDGKQIASINCESSVKLWDPETGMLERRLVGHTYYIECVAYSPDGRTLATGGRDHVAILWDVATGKVLHTLRGHDSRVSSLAFSPDGKTLITADWKSSSQCTSFHRSGDEQEAPIARIRPGRQ